MPLLRNLGNNLGTFLHRRDHSETLASNNGSTLGSNHGGGGGGLAATISNKMMMSGLGGGGDIETPDLYYEDRGLGKSVKGLEDVRMALRDLTSAVNLHRNMLMNVAGSERALGDMLVSVMDGGGNGGMRKGGNHGEDSELEFSDLESKTGDDEVGGGNGGDGMYVRFLNENSIAAGTTLGRSMVVDSGGAVKLATAMSMPINDLQRSFEERFARKIVPLRKRYIDQKGQYLKYKRQADLAEEEEKRSYNDALAEAAKPVWVRTSKELKTEADVMTQLTAKNMAKWSCSLALQHERFLALSAATFSDAFGRAKAARGKQ